MDILGPAGETLRLAEHYRLRTDEELIALAQHKEELTEMAQQALAGEISSRRLMVPPAEADAQTRPALPPDSSDGEDLYQDEHRLVEIRTVWSERDARQLQNVLDTAGIPFCMGLEKAARVDGITSDFAKGVPVAVMQVGVPWALQAMKNYFPNDEPPEPKYEDAGEVAIHCPKCHATDVVFDQLVDESAETSDESTEKYQWTCDQCGYGWEDDGVETK